MKVSVLSYIRSVDLHIRSYCPLYKICGNEIVLIMNLLLQKMSRRGGNQGGYNAAPRNEDNTQGNVNIAEIFNQLAAFNVVAQNHQRIDVERFLKYRPPYFKGTPDPRVAK